MILLQTLPFFAIIALGYGAGRTGFFNEDATRYLTKFVFFFALSAMIFRFAANIELSEVWDARLIAAYLWGTAFVYGIATIVGFLRNLNVATNAIEAQCAVIGNIGFLGLPMLTLILGEAAIGPIMMMLAVDLIIFSSLVVILVTGSQDGQMSIRILKTVGLGLIKNPMIGAMTLGLLCSGFDVTIPVPLNEFLAILGGLQPLGHCLQSAHPLPRNQPNVLQSLAG